LGFKDDFGKILTKDNLKGVKWKRKTCTTRCIAVIVSLLLIYVAKFPTTIYIPFVKDPIIDLGLFATPFWVFVFLATTNAVNITDGLDGLATVPSIFSLVTLAIIVYITGNYVLSREYLLLPNIGGVGEITVLASSLILGRPLILGISLWGN